MNVRIAFRYVRILPDLILSLGNARARAKKPVIYTILKKKIVNSPRQSFSFIKRFIFFVY